MALADPDAIRNSLNQQLSQLVTDPDFRGTWAGDEWVIGSDTFTLSVVLQKATQRFIHLLPFHALYLPLSPDGVEYDLYRLPEGFQDQVFDPSQTLEKVGRHKLAQREPVMIRSDRYAYHFRINRPTLMLKLVSPLFRTMEWLFSCEHLKAWQANDADFEFSRLRVASSVLGRLAHQSSVKPLERLTQHPHHAVRWAAIQNLARIYRAAAVEALGKAVSDPHPHVQRAARKALESLSK